MKCPKGCQNAQSTHYSECPTDEFLRTKASQFSDRVGVKTIEGTEQNPPTIAIKIDYRPYNTDNYFKYRNDMERDDSIIVKDIEPDLVEVQFRGVLVKPVYRCTECGIVYDAETQNKIDETGIFDVSAFEYWNATRLT